MLVVHGWTSSSPPRVSLDGAELAADVGFFASVDESADQAWITLRGRLSGTHDVQVF